MKIFLQIQFCLLLLKTLSVKAQQVTASDDVPACPQRQYKNDADKCCSLCRPGTYVRNECNATSDTQCQPCEEGKFTSNWNYATSCRICRPCPQHLVEKEKCSPTEKEQCVCPSGYSCTQHTGLGVCLVCKPISWTTAEPPTPEAGATKATSGFTPWVMIIVIIATLVIIVFAALMIFYIHQNAWVLEKLGCTSKVKKPLPESTGLEANIPPTQAQVLLPDKDLHYPMEETDATQSSAYALNPLHRHPI